MAIIADAGGSSNFVVTDYDRLQMRHNQPRGFLMDGMRQIRIARRGALEEHDEAVREALRESLGAVVWSPREVEDAGNLLRQILDDAPDLGDLLRRAVGFELKKAICLTCFFIRVSGSRMTFRPRADYDRNPPTHD